MLYLFFVFVFVIYALVFGVLSDHRIKIYNIFCLLEIWFTITKFVDVAAFNIYDEQDGGMAVN